MVSINTVDTSPSFRLLFFVYNPDLLKGMLNGMEYSESAVDSFIKAYDLGTTYPIATGKHTAKTCRWRKAAIW